MGFQLMGLLANLMASHPANLKLVLKRLLGAALSLYFWLAMFPIGLTAQEQAQPQVELQAESQAQPRNGLPRYATWRIGEFGDIKKIDGIYRISYSPDGRYLASRSKNNVVVVYELKTRTVVCEVEGHDDWIETIDFSPDSEFFVTASGGSDKVKIWKTQTGRLESTIEAGRAAYFSQSGKLINVLGETHVESYSWPGAQLTQRRKWKSSNETARAMSRDGRFVVAFRSLNKQFYQTLIVDTKSNSRVPLSGATAIPRAVKISADNSWVAASYHRDPKIHLWSVADPKQGRYTLNGHLETVQSLSFSPDNRFLVSSGWDQNVIVWDLLTRQAVRKFEGHQAHVNATAWAPLSFAFASGASGSKDCSMIAWDIEPILFPGHDQPGLKSGLSVEQQLESIWKSLGASSLRLSMRATSQLAAGGDYFLEALDNKIKDTISVHRSGLVEDFLEQLDDPDYQLRQQATEALLKIIETVEAKLRAELKRTSSPEVKYRISKILKKERPRRGKSDLVVNRRWRRIILALEKIDTERSQAILKNVSLGHRNAEIASHAKESFERNVRRHQLSQ